MRSLFKKAMRDKKGDLYTASDENTASDLNISEAFLGGGTREFDSEALDVVNDLPETPEEMYDTN